MNEYVGKKVPGAEPAKGAYRTQQPGKMLFSRSVGREIQSPFNAVEVGIAFSFCLFSGMRECLVRSEVAPPICLPAGCRQARGRKRLKNIPLAVFCRPPGNLGKSHGSKGERGSFFSSSFALELLLSSRSKTPQSHLLEREEDRKGIGGGGGFFGGPCPSGGKRTTRGHFSFSFFFLVLFALSLLLFFSFHFPFSGKNLVRESPTSVVKFPLGANCALPRGQKVSSPLLLSWSIEIN